MMLLPSSLLQLLLMIPAVVAFTHTVPSHIGAWRLGAPVFASTVGPSPKAQVFLPRCARSRQCSFPLCAAQEPPTDGRAELEDRLLSDIEQFKRSKDPDLGTVGDASEAEPSLVRRTIDVLGTVLTYNFFIICAFFLWFLTGVGAQYGAQNDAIIQAFRGAWDYIIQPLLGTHMLLTFISAGLERMVKE